MYKKHGCVFAKLASSGRVMPELAQIQSGHASALKPPHKAGRRGEDSIAR